MATEKTKFNKEFEKELENIAPLKKEGAQDASKNRHFTVRDDHDNSMSLYGHPYNVVQYLDALGHMATIDGDGNVYIMDEN